MVNKFELRIGNKVLLGKDIVTLTEVGAFEASFEERNFVYPYVTLEPVPISPAILEACGFEYIDQVGGWCNKHHVIYGADHWMIHPFCTNDTDVHIKVEYLHQLQNICFALDPTGTELSINLEKVKA